MKQGRNKNKNSSRLQMKIITKKSSIKIYYTSEGVFINCVPNCEQGEQMKKHTLQRTTRRNSIQSKKKRKIQSVFSNNILCAERIPNISALWNESRPSILILRIIVFTSAFSNSKL